MQCPACNARIDDSDVECSSCGLKLDSDFEPATESPAQDHGEPIQFVLPELTEPKGVVRNIHFWNVLVTASQVAIYQADSGAAALLGGIGIMVAHLRRKAKAQQLVGKTIGEATRDCDPLFIFERKAGRIRLECRGKPGRHVVLKLYGMRRVYRIILPANGAADLRAACPEVVLEPELEDWRRNAAAYLGLPLVGTGGGCLAYFANEAGNMVGTVGTEVPLMFLIGLAALVGGAYLASWSLRTDRLDPDSRKALGTALIVFGILGLPGSLFVLGPILSEGTSAPLPGLLQFLRLASFALCVVVAVLLICLGISARRRGEREREERRKSQAAQQTAPASLF
jgi:hypothetical protein